MTVYNFKARNKEGVLVDSTMEAENEQAVISKLKAQDYFVIEVNRNLAKQQININIGIFNKVRLRDLAIMTRQFSTLINSGMSLVESLEVLSRQTSNEKLSKVLIDVRQNVESGLSLSEAMAKHPGVFSSMYLSLVNAGEMGGALDITLNRLATFLEKENEMRLRINNKTAYPKFVLAFAIVIVIAMIIFIIPTFKGIYDDLGVELPTITKMVILVGDIFKKWYTYIILIGLFFGFRYLNRKILSTPGGRRFFDRIRMKIPKIGDIIRKIAISRFSRTLGTLIASGVPILRSLEILKGVTDNAIIDDAIDDIIEDIKEGESISNPMGKHKVFTPMMVQMVSVGERSGTIDDMLEKISDFYDEEVTNSVEIITTILEPLMLLVVALIVAVILLSLYIPLFSIYQNIG